MSMTLAEKILAAHCDRKEVRPGDLINCRVDFLMANDVTAPLSIEQFEKLGVKTVFDPKRIAFIPSHFIPNKDILSAGNAKAMRDFAREHGLVYLEQGRAGIEHAILPERGWVLPGDVVIGAGLEVLRRDQGFCQVPIAVEEKGDGQTEIAWERMSKLRVPSRAHPG